MIAQDQLIGSRFEKCIVERLIGRGGYGLTFLAFDEELQEHRVIKISQDSGMDEVSRRRHLKTFLEEGLILSRLKHPQIVTLRGQGDKHGHRYMILDYIQGYSLRNVLDIVGQRQAELGCAWQDLLDPVTASALILSALYPMEYAHRANVHLPDREIFGVAHRDISPGNLILGVKGNEKGRLVLIDFGTAKTALTENVTVDQNLVGTIPYMGKARLQKANSAEQKAQYQDFWKDFRETQHDIHAIGVLYYQLLTGRLPFYGETSPQIIVKILDPEVYSQCHLEIASAHSFASGVLRKCIVYHDFSVPLGDQPYQYPDAASMRPDMEEVFHSLSGGKTVNDVLIALGKKLAHPELMVPIDGRQSTGQASSAEIPAIAAPGGYVTSLGLPFPHRRRPPALYASAIAGGLMLALGAAWWLSPRHSHLAEGALVPNDSKSSHSGIPAQAGVNGAGAKDAGHPGSGGEALENLDGPAQAPGKSRSGAGRKTDRDAAAARNTPAMAARGSGQPGGTVKVAALATLASETIQAGDVWNQEAFVQVQTMVREEDASAFERISGYLAKNPESPDLRLLKAQLVLMRNPASPEIRRDLVALQGVRPEFMHPNLFHEQVLFLLWKTDAATFEAQKTPASRINMVKSANVYISEFQPNAAYQQKVKAIQERLPH
ncbi:MAG: pknH 4 [Fibrobacteres bacterium]|nr:pknH 4 [Fibrobacterota bacterium]